MIKCISPVREFAGRVDSFKTYCKHEGGILKVSLSHHDQIPPAAH